jgi:hypothetical protein
VSRAYENPNARSLCERAFLKQRSTLQFCIPEQIVGNSDADRKERSTKAKSPSIKSSLLRLETRFALFATPDGFGFLRRYRKRSHASLDRGEAALLSPKPPDEVELDAG